jgi:hypothetical protein
MCWDAAAAYGSHGEHATLAPAPTWYLAEGATHSGFELFYLILNPASTAVDLIANPSASDATVKVTVLYADGAPAQSVEVEVVAEIRFNIDMRTRFPDTVGRAFGVQIESLGTTPVPIVVEWAIYSDALGQRWAAGANALATVVK